MRYLLALVLLALLLSGCATDPDDHGFFSDGWMHPEEGSNRRLMAQ